MEKECSLVDELLSKITISSNPNNQPVSIQGHVSELKCIGVGTDAAVFQYIHAPAYAYKLFADDKVDKIQMEVKVYEKLGASPYFSKCFHASDRYLVVSFESGITLYECLQQGIHIPSKVIHEVDEARDYARSKGLNPRDIHLKNILLQDGRAKIIDVSEYLVPGDDCRWEHLKRGYEEYYHLIDGRSIPTWLLETVRKSYNARQTTGIEDFFKDVMKLKWF
ncbi:serine/threonine protein kinase [Robertmurraya korlensis]|uniref:serine/threonine protein kinase n=1 Tax=Robertmurraya korlensis TaxID=519977 RepID=UPI000825FEF6|nr:serine/threonine protein kinase [Robertmurraya korlensis]